MTEKTYSHRYYASYHKEKGHVTGWYDIHSMSHTKNVPDEKDLLALTEEEWESRTPSGHGVKNGKLVNHTQVSDVIPEAEHQLRLIRKHINEEYLMMNEQVPTELVEYQKKLKRVIKGELKKLPVNPLNT